MQSTQIRCKEVKPLREPLNDIPVGCTEEEPHGRHPMTAGEVKLQQLIGLCGFIAKHEPLLVMFKLLCSACKLPYDFGVQADFWVPELGLFVELTAKRDLDRKHKQVALMIRQGYKMLLIDALIWADILGAPEESDPIRAERLMRYLQIASAPDALSTPVPLAS